MANDSECRSIVLSGNGKAFCAGIDLKEGIAKITEVVQNDEMDVARKARALRTLISGFQNDFTAIEKVSYTFKMKINEKLRLMEF